MKKVYKDNRRRYIGQQPGTKSACGPADEPLDNRLSSTVVFLHRFYIGFPLFVLPSKHPGGHSSIGRRASSGGKRGCFPLGEQSRRRPVLPVAARPRRPAVSRPIPTARGLSGFWTRQVCTMIAKIFRVANCRSGAHFEFQSQSCKQYWQQFET